MAATTAQRLTLAGLCAVLALSGCVVRSPLASDPPPTATPGSASPPDFTPSPEPSPTEAVTETPSPTRSPVAEFGFVRWNSDNVALVTEPGGNVAVATTGDERIAAVLDRTFIDGMEWIRVQVGRGYAQDFVANGWAPYAADVREGGRLVHVEPVYEPVDPDCPDGEPTVLDLDAMLPLQSLYCFGSRTLTFSAVQVRDEGSEESALVDGTPEWLSVGGNLVMYWLPERNELGSIRIYVDPAAQVDVPQHTWLEVTGQLDHPGARSCTRTSEHPEFAVANEAEAVQICRARFVVTAVRTLSEAEIPPLPPAGAPGPQPEVTIAVTVQEVRAPVATRDGASAVWTGTQLLVWGGWDARQDHSFRPLNDGAAYTPSTGRWRRIPPAPIAGRGQALAVWTGSELLVWGGNRTEDEPLQDGAAYDPVSDAWRPLAPSPLTWNWRGASTWTGSEWWIAAEASGGATDVAAYDPAADSWRQLPSVDDMSADAPAIAWTGAEILLFSAAGLFRMPAAGSQWMPARSDFHEPAVWTGQLLVGMRDDPTSVKPLEFDYISHPVAWDPMTDRAVELPTPPRSVYGPVLAGTHLAFFETGLAFDLTTRQWLNLDIDRVAQTALDQVGETAVWAGDRLIVWGGDDPCFETSPDRAIVFELIPAWGVTDLDGTASYAGAAGQVLLRLGLPAATSEPVGAGMPPVVVAAC